MQVAVRAADKARFGALAQPGGQLVQRGELRSLPAGNVRRRQACLHGRDGVPLRNLA